MSSKIVEKYMSREDLPGFFREFADALEGGSGDEFACAETFAKLKIRVREEYGRFSVRVKFKPAGDCDQPVPASQAAAAPRPGYSTLKKRMKQSFGMIFKMIHQGELPPREAVDDFLAQSALMVTYEGYGDEAYDDYARACAEFSAAYEAADMDALNRTVDLLVHQKAHCHARHA
jgi:XXXCH domain-containing protein